MTDIAEGQYVRLRGNRLGKNLASIRQFDSLIFQGGVAYVYGVCKRNGVQVGIFYRYPPPSYESDGPYYVPLIFLEPENSKKPAAAPGE